MLEVITKMNRDIVAWVNRYEDGLVLRSEYLANACLIVERALGDLCAMDSVPQVELDKVAMVLSKCVGDYEAAIAMCE